MFKKIEPTDSRSALAPLVRRLSVRERNCLLSIFEIIGTTRIPVAVPRPFLLKRTGFTKNELSYTLNCLVQEGFVERWSPVYIKVKKRPVGRGFARTTYYRIKQHALDYLDGKIPS